MTDTANPFERPLASDFQADIETRRRNFYNFPAKAENECFFCGRGLTPKAVANGWWVNLVTDGTLTTRDDEVSDSQGTFPIGSECAKRIQRPFKFKTTEEV